jgi:hypothetical protein
MFFPKRLKTLGVARAFLSLVRRVRSRWLVIMADEGLIVADGRSISRYRVMLLQFLEDNHSDSFLPTLWRSGNFGKGFHEQLGHRVIIDQVGIKESRFREVSISGKIALMTDHKGSRPSPVVVLHLTDLHFGWDGTRSETDNRTLALRSLIGELEKLDEECRPNIVCISGDIGWRGQESDYTLAKTWLSELLSKLKLSPSDMVVCPGNHDINRNEAIGMRPQSPGQADNVLSVPIKDSLSKPFAAFETFCREFGIPPLDFGTDTSFLIGKRTLKAIPSPLKLREWRQS